MVDVNLAPKNNVDIPKAVNVDGMRVWDFDTLQNSENEKNPPLIIITGIHKNEISAPKSDEEGNDNHEVLGALKEKYSQLGRRVVVIEVPLKGLILEGERQYDIKTYAGIKEVDPNRQAAGHRYTEQPNPANREFYDDATGIEFEDAVAQKTQQVNDREQKVLDYIEKYYKGSPVLTIHADKEGEPLNVQEDDNRFYLYIQAHSGKADKTTEEYRLLWKSCCKELVVNKFGIEPKDIEALKQEQDPPFDIDDPDHEIDNGVILTYNSAYTEDGSVEDSLHHLESDTFTLEIPSCFDQPERLWFVKEFLEHFAAKLPVKAD